MKKLISVAFLTSVLGVSAAYAEEAKPTRGFDRLAKELELQDSQREPVQQILERQHEELKKLRTETFKNLKEKEAKIHAETRKQLGKVLQKDQQEKLKQLDEKRAERFKERQERFKEKKERKEQHKDHRKGRDHGKGERERHGKHQ